MLKLTELTAAIQLHWTAHNTTNVPIQFPGVPLNSHRESAWFELWITQVREPVQRVTANERATALIDIHCFSRSKSDKRQLETLIDIARKIVHEQMVIVTDAEANPVAVLRFQETATRNLSRLNKATTADQLQHAVVSASARVEECS